MSYQSSHRSHDDESNKSHDAFAILPGLAPACLEKAGKPVAVQIRPGESQKASQHRATCNDGQNGCLSETSETPRRSAPGANAVAERLEARSLKLAFGYVGPRAVTGRALSMVIHGHNGRFGWLLHDARRGQVLNLVSPAPVLRVGDSRRAA